MNNQLIIFDIVICKKPLKMGQRTLLCDEMWLPINEYEIQLLEPIKDKLVHTIHTRENQTYDELVDGSYLNILSDYVYSFLLNNSLFAKFYATYSQYLNDWQLSISKELDVDINHLELLGWEVVNNCGSSASYDGIYPLNSYSDFFYVKNELIDIFPINKWGLFYDLKYALEYCELNNKSNQDSSPWVPIAVLCKKEDLMRLDG